MKRKWSDMIDKRMRWYLLWSAVGMVLGYGYYLLLGYAGGFGPLPFSPFLTVLFGGAVGWFGFGSYESEKGRVPGLEKAAVRVRVDHRE